MIFGYFNAYGAVIAALDAQNPRLWQSDFFAVKNN